MLLVIYVMLYTWFYNLLSCYVVWIFKGLLRSMNFQGIGYSFKCYTKHKRVFFIKEQYEQGFPPPPLQTHSKDAFSFQDHFIILIRQTIIFFKESLNNLCSARLTRTISSSEWSWKACGQWVLTEDQLHNPL